MEWHAVLHRWCNRPCSDWSPIMWKAETSDSSLHNQCALISRIRISYESTNYHEHSCYQQRRWSHQNISTTVWPKRLFSWWSEFGGGSRSSPSRESSRKDTPCQILWGTNRRTEKQDEGWSRSPRESRSCQQSYVRTGHYVRNSPSKMASYLKERESSSRRAWNHSYWTGCTTVISA